MLIGRAYGLGWAALLALGPILAAAPHRPRLHANPEITILGIAEGQDGLLWLAAREGLYRFDGFRFLNVPDSPLRSASGIAVTDDGSVWAASDEGLFRDEGDGFQLVAPGRIERFAGGTDRVFAAVEELIQGQPTGVLWVFPQSGPPVRVGDAGRQHIVADASGDAWLVCGHRLTQSLRACVNDANQPWSPVALPPWTTAVVADGRGRLVVADAVHAEVLDEGRATARFERRPVQASSRPPPLAAGASGQVWFTGETVYGVKPAVELSEGPGLDERSFPTVAFEDSRGRLWVAWRGRGLMEWELKKDWRRWYSEDLAGAEPAQVLQTASGAIVAAVGTRLFELGPDDGWRELADLGRAIAAVKPMTDGGFIASLRDFGVARLSAHGRILGRFRQPELDRIDAPWAADQYREPQRDSRGRWWVGSKVSLMRLESTPSGPVLRLAPMPGTATDSPLVVWDDNVVDLELDDEGTLWAGAPRGLLRLGPDDVWRRLPTDQPLDPVRSFTVGDRDVWVANRTGGPHFTRLVNDGQTWRVERFAADAGYQPEDTHFIKRDSRGWIWRGSSDGVHVSDGSRFAPNDWLHLRARNGMAGEITEQYGFFEDRDGVVWISAFEGITAVHPNPEWFGTPANARPPVISSITADGVDHTGTSPLPSGVQELLITIGSLDSPPFRERPFRYRIPPIETEWRLSRDGALTLESPPAGEYRLEVAFSGDPPSAAPRLSYGFRVGDVGTAPIWPIWWSGGSIVLGMALIATLAYPPWRERAAYTLAKSWFLARRIWKPRAASSPNKAAEARRLAPGEVLRDRYRTVRELSKGGFSAVYEVSDLEADGRRVAAKLLAPSPGKDRWLRDRFAHEIAALRSVSHPGVIEILDSWVTPQGEPCLIMPLIEGPTLREALAAGPFPPAKAADLLRALGAAVAAVHRSGIVHRDLKPENILLDGSKGRPRPLLIDFGLAAIRGPEDRLADTTLLAGSLNYMAPERLSGRFSAASDIYSLAVLAMEFLTGSRPSDLQVSPDEEEFGAALKNVLALPVGASAAQRVAPLIARGLALTPQERPSDAASWSAELADALEPRSA